MATISPLSLVRNGEVDARPSTVQELREEVRETVTSVLSYVEEQAESKEPVSFRVVEQELRRLVFAFARAVVVLFLALREQRLARYWKAGGQYDWSGRTFRSKPAIARNFTTMFGVVRYWRTYMREVASKDPHGFHPLDVFLGLGSDRFSWNVLAMAARLATRLSFMLACRTLSDFVPNAPSTEVVEQVVLGLGRHTEKWFEHKPPPEDDGEVLVIMFDSKGIPTATEEELSRRRGKRRRRRPEPSARHRGRRKRRGWPKKPRRKKGDKSKNAKMATMFIMYTLRRNGARLEGPINRTQYVSLAPKRHAFRIARREADKRGFAEGSGKLIQIVTDGDDDLATYRREYFSEAIHTIDVWHVIEYLWTAGQCFHNEGTKELERCVHEMKCKLYDGNVAKLLDELQRRLDAIPKTGPGNKGRRERLTGVIRYLSKRIDQMNYRELRRKDLEISTGPMEGAIKHVIGKRCDHGGMRWIKERAEALLQLRCIELNGDWEAFERYVHNTMQATALVDLTRLRLQRKSPQPLPNLRQAA